MGAPSSGALTESVMVPPRIMLEPTGHTSSVPRIAHTTTGTPLFFARSKNGGLNSISREGSAAAAAAFSASKPMRVPSGKMATELPASSVSCALSRSWPVAPFTMPQPPFEPFGSNLTGRSPAFFIAQPPNGTEKRSPFATYLVSSGSRPEQSANGSMNERWLHTTSTPLRPATTSGGGVHEPGATRRRNMGWHQITKRENQRKM